jgi:phosphocarrier protein HPr
MIHPALTKAGTAASPGSDYPALEQWVRVTNEQGLHTRPATAIVKILQGTRCEVIFTHKNETVNARSILSIMMLAAKKNARIKIRISGVDGERVMEQLVQGFMTGFGE